MIAFNRVCGVYDLPDLRRILKKRSQLRPVSIPGFQDIGIFSVPLFAEFFLCELCIIKIYCAVYLLGTSKNSAQGKYGFWIFCKQAGIL